VLTYRSVFRKLVASSLVITAAAVATRRRLPEHTLVYRTVQTNFPSLFAQSLMRLK
jgi:hypothetical protein